VSPSRRILLMGSFMRVLAGMCFEEGRNRC
jgi:hypothetical protein